MRQNLAAQTAAAPGRHDGAVLGAAGVVGVNELSKEDPYPYSLTSEWFLDLDPRRQYCATLSARGDGDNARPKLLSEPLCASVIQLCAKDADCNGMAAESDEDGGCSTARHWRSTPFAALMLLAVALGWTRRAAGRPRCRSGPARRSNVSSSSCVCRLRDLPR